MSYAIALNAKPSTREARTVRETRRAILALNAALYKHLRRQPDRSRQPCTAEAPLLRHLNSKPTGFRDAHDQNSQRLELARTVDSDASPTANYLARHAIFHDSDDALCLPPMRSGAAGSGLGGKGDPQALSIL